MTVRAEVYAWDGTKAHGPSLYEKKRTVSYPGDRLFHTESFKPSGISVSPGAQYVLFASTDKNWTQCQNQYPYSLGWGGTGDDAYEGGEAVYQTNGGHKKNWTNRPWETSNGNDFVFKVVLGA
jgi:hypothetical protein